MIAVSKKMSNFAQHFNFMKIRLPILLLSAIMLSSCGEYERLLKSSDHQLKKERAIEYFEEGRYTRTVELLAQVLPRFRGSDQAEELNWINARAHYELRDYIMAGSLFKRFSEEFSWSRHAEEAFFLAAYCNYLLSPRPELDQYFTVEAIDGFNQFKRRYPFSDRIEEVDSLIAEMNEKLVEKSYLSARLYYDMRQYRAAAIALASALNDFPETRFREEMMFLQLESQYLFARNSVPERQLERFQTAYDEYLTFIEEFPETEYTRDVERIYNSLMRFLRPEENDDGEDID